MYPLSNTEAIICNKSTLSHFSLFLFSVFFYNEKSEKLAYLSKFQNIFSNLKKIENVVTLYYFLFRKKLHEITSPQ
jgi:hypothetical protein